MRPLVVASALLLVSVSAFGQQRSELTLPPGGNGRSQRAEVSQWIGLVKIPIVSGRGVGREDGAMSRRVAVISESMARRYFANVERRERLRASS